MSVWFYLETDPAKLTGKTIRISNITNEKVAPTDTIYIYVRSQIVIGISAILRKHKIEGSTIVSKNFIKLDPPISFKSIFDECLDKTVSTQKNSKVFMMNHFKKETVCRLEVNGSKLKTYITKYIETAVHESQTSSQEYVSNDIFVKKYATNESDESQLSELNDNVHVKPIEVIPVIEEKIDETLEETEYVSGLGHNIYDNIFKKRDKYL